MMKLLMPASHKNSYDIVQVCRQGLQNLDPILADSIVIAANPLNHSATQICMHRYPLYNFMYPCYAYDLVWRAFVFIFCCSNYKSVFKQRGNESFKLDFLHHLFKF